MPVTSRVAPLFASTSRSAPVSSIAATIDPSWLIEMELIGTSNSIGPITRSPVARSATASVLPYGSVAARVSGRRQRRGPRLRSQLARGGYRMPWVLARDVECANEGPAVEVENLHGVVVVGERRPDASQGCVHRTSRRDRPGRSFRPARATPSAPPSARIEFARRQASAGMPQRRRSSATSRSVSRNESEVLVSASICAEARSRAVSWAPIATKPPAAAATANSVTAAPSRTRSRRFWARSARNGVRSRRRRRAPALRMPRRRLLPMERARGSACIAPRYDGVEARSAVQVFIRAPIRLPRRARRTRERTHRARGLGVVLQPASETRPRRRERLYGRR